MGQQNTLRECFFSLSRNRRHENSREEESVASVKTGEGFLRRGRVLLSPCDFSDHCFSNTHREENGAKRAVKRETGDEGEKRRGVVNGTK